MGAASIDEITEASADAKSPAVTPAGQFANIIT
jgi:hypothetical protein